MGCSGDIDHSLCLPFPPWADHEYAALCKQCWDLNPARRPTASQVVGALKALAARLLGPAAAHLFPSVAFALQVGVKYVCVCVCVCVCVWAQGHRQPSCWDLLQHTVPSVACAYVCDGGQR